MAKAKKQESAAAEDKAAKPKAAAAKKAPAKTEAAAAAKPTAAAAKKPAAAPKKPAAAAGGAKPSVPLIDTGLAAQTAAAMVARRVSGGTAGGAPSQESSTFKNLKESLSKPTAGGLGGILGTGTGQKKFPQQFGGGKPGGSGSGGRNQTFGADVNRAGVPRRTGGG